MEKQQFLIQEKPEWGTVEKKKKQATCAIHASDFIRVGRQKGTKKNDRHQPGAVYHFRI